MPKGYTRCRTHALRLHGAWKCSLGTRRCACLRHKNCLSVTHTQSMWRWTVDALTDGGSSVRSSRNVRWALPRALLARP